MARRNTKFSVGKSEENGYHPSYSSADGDLVLISKDSVKFRVHSSILRIASDVFSGMFEASNDSGEPIGMDDDSAILEIILTSIYPNGSSVKFKMSSFPELWLIFDTAEKYDIRRPQNDLKNCMDSSAYLKEYPLECYALACRFGWDDLIQRASAATLDIDLRTNHSKNILKYLDGRHLLDIVALHGKRRFMLVEAIKVEVVSSLSEGQKLLALRLPEVHKNLRLENTAQMAIKYLVSSEMEKCSRGRTLMEESFWRKENTKNLVNGWNLDYLRDEFKRLLKMLPQTVSETSVTGYSDTDKL